MALESGLQRLIEAVDQSGDARDFRMPRISVVVGTACRALLDDGDQVVVVRAINARRKGGVAREVVTPGCFEEQTVCNRRRPCRGLNVAGRVVAHALRFRGARAGATARLVLPVVLL